jgi:hypothetical protein
MPDRPNPPMPAGGGASYGQTDFGESARRSKAREKRAEETPTRSADKPAAEPKRPGGA